MFTTPLFTHTPENLLLQRMLSSNYKDDLNIESLLQINITSTTNSIISASDNIHFVPTDALNNWVENILQRELTYTKPGSITYLLYGKKTSEQSINIKFGHFGEVLSKELIKMNSDFELLPCGIQNINNKKKDVDLIFKDVTNKTIYYRELKGNIELDTEKLPATIEKCKEIEISLKTTYPDYEINCGILNWSVYNRTILKSGLSNIKSFEKNGIQINHMEDFLQILKIIWSEEDYYLYFSGIGDKIKNM